MEKGASAVQVQSQRLIFHPVAPGDTFVRRRNSDLWVLMSDERWFIFFAAARRWTNASIIQLCNILHYDKDTYIGIYESGETHS